MASLTRKKLHLASTKWFEYRWMIVIFLLSFGLRVLASDVPLNIDEDAWMHRGLLFFKNLYEHNLAETYLRHHPGVPNMWLSGGSVIFYCGLQKGLAVFHIGSASSLMECLATRPFPVSFYVAARFSQAVVTSICLVGIYALARQLLGKAIALIGVSLLMLEPFFLAYQRLITTDALQTSFATLAWLSLLLYLRGTPNPRSGPIGSRRLLLLSGVSFGLATASKVPTLFVLPALGGWVLLIELGIWAPRFPRRKWRQVVDGGIWGGVAIATIFLIWPALWVAPLETLQRLAGDLLEEGAGSAQLFLGRLTESPSLGFYPVVLLYRLSPALCLGLLGTAGMVLTPSLRRSLPLKRELQAIALIPVSILVVLSLSSSKIDRYIVPFLPELAFLAAVGWYGTGLQVGQWLHPVLSRWQWSKVKKLSRIATAWAVLLVGMTQLLVLLPTYPYYLTYYNPLLGGAKTAQFNLMMGNGEGLDQAARWLNQTPAAESTTVASWYSNIFSTYFQGKTLKIDKTDALTNQNLWLEAHRVVFYINQLQRQFPNPKMLAYFTAQQPLHTVKLNGVEHAWVYPGPVPLPEELEQLQQPRSPYGDQYLRLRGYEFSQTAPQAGQLWVLTLYWQVITPPPADFNVLIRWRDRHNQSVLDYSSPPMAGFLPVRRLATGMVWRDAHLISVPASLAGGVYQLEVNPMFQATSLPQEESVPAPAVLNEVEVLPTKL